MIHMRALMPVVALRVPKRLGQELLYFGSLCLLASGDNQEGPVR